MVNCSRLRPHITYSVITQQASCFAWSFGYESTFLHPERSGSVFQSCISSHNSLSLARLTGEESEKYFKSLLSSQWNQYEEINRTHKPWEGPFARPAGQVMGMEGLHSVVLAHSYSPVASALMQRWENNTIQVCLAGRQKEGVSFFSRKVCVIALEEATALREMCLNLYLKEVGLIKLWIQTLK